MRLMMNYHGVELCRDDFGDDLRDVIAFTLAFVANTHCRDKAAALELLYHEADRIIELVNGPVDARDEAAAVADLRTVSELLDSVPGPQPWAVNEAAAIARRYRDRG